MTYWNSSYTGRAPRTMAEAFGPYESGPVLEQARAMDWQDIVALAGSIAAAAVMVVMGLVGWLK